MQTDGYWESCHVECGPGLEQGLAPWGAAWTETRWGLEKRGHLGSLERAGGDAGSGRAWRALGRWA